MSALALDGVRVVDLSTHATGPFATQILAALGATVVKVERPPDGDPERSTEFAMFHACNRGKYSVALDVKRSTDRDVLDALIVGCDVFVEGFRPGVADRLGLSFEQLSKRCPSLVYVSLPGFGSTGPYADRRGYDVEYRAVAGELWVSREPGRLPRYTDGPPFFDFATAMYAVVGVLAALRPGARTAVRIEVPILAAGLAWTFPRLIDAAKADRPGPRTQHAFVAADGLPLTVTYPTTEQFHALCELLDRNDLKDRPDLQDFEGRAAQAALLNEVVSAAIATRPRDAWLDALEAAGVAAAPIRGPHDVFDDPQVRHLDVIHGGDVSWADVPILGLPRRPLVDSSAVDQHGDLVRTGGWSALEDEPLPGEPCR
jgi:crotonobetainyl-CoA:carnitine CoA-transferase CaiB-like acyl-CoA transferase